MESLGFFEVYQLSARNPMGNSSPVWTTGVISPDCHGGRTGDISTGCFGTYSQGLYNPHPTSSSSYLGLSLALTACGIASITLQSTHPMSVSSIRL